MSTIRIKIRACRSFDQSQTHTHTHARASIIWHYVENNNNNNNMRKRLARTKGYWTVCCRVKDINMPPLPFTDAVSSGRTSPLVQPPTGRWLYPALPSTPPPSLTIVIVTFKITNPPLLLLQYDVLYKKILAPSYYNHK